MRIGIFLRQLNGDGQYACVTRDGRAFVVARDSTWKITKEKTETDQVRRTTRLLLMNVPQTLSGAEYTVFKLRVNGFRLCVNLLEYTPEGKPRFSFDPDSTFSHEPRILRLPPMYIESNHRAGMIDITAQQLMIKKVMIGYDFQSNPVCFISTSKSVNFESPLLHQHWSGQDIGGKRPIDDAGKLWAIKGDRINGITTTLTALNKLERVCKLRIVRAEVDGSLVWDVIISKMSDGGLNQVLRRRFMSRSVVRPEELVEPP